ncbi:MAG TPA: hypothetical protein VIM19_05270 [Actinomycetes bacterium]
MPDPNTPELAARCARLVAWGNAVLTGRVSPDAAAEQVAAGVAGDRVDGLPGGDDQNLTVALARLSARGLRGLRLVLPTPGDPLGLRGPGPLLAAALDCGAAVVLVAADEGPVLVPAQSGDGPVRWTAFPASSSDGADIADRSAAALPSLAEADRDLAVALREATELLVQLDVARCEPAAEDALEALREGGYDGDGLAPGYPDRAFGVLVRARRLAAIVAVASAFEGATVTAAEADLRREALLPLARAARYAQMAAHNAVFEPQGARLR